jgi:DNA-binding Lrp family transcriptional regulator
MQEISILSRKILRELCSDSRVGVTELSRKLGVSRPMIARHIRSLERELGLCYTLELDYKALGLVKLYLYHIKFTKRPTEEELVSFFTRSRRVQLALLTKGQFDLAIFTFQGDEEEFAIWDQNLVLGFPKCGVSARKSDIDVMNFGFIPFDANAIESSSLEDRTKKMLLILNQDSRITIRDLANKLGMSEDLATYHMQKLVKAGVIRRFTTIITKLKCSSIIYFARYVFDEHYISGINEERKVTYFRKEAQVPVFNDFQMVLSVSGAEDHAAWISKDTIKDAMGEIVSHKRIFRRERPKITYAVLEKPVKGLMPMRNLGIRENYVATEWVPGQMYK